VAGAAREPVQQPLRPEGLTKGAPMGEIGFDFDDASKDYAKPSS
jgi:hypothetical protein